MKNEVVASLRAPHGKHERLIRVDDPHMGDERLVEKLIEGGAFVRRLVRKAAYAGAIGQRIDHASVSTFRRICSTSSKWD